MAALKSAGEVTENIFGFLLTLGTQQSYIDLGGYSTSAMRTPSDLRWIACSTDEFFWEIPFTGFRYSSSDTLPSDSTITSAYSIESVLGIIDTGTTLVYLPYGKMHLIDKLKDYSQKFLGLLLKDMMKQSTTQDQELTQELVT